MNNDKKRVFEKKVDLSDGDLRLMLEVEKTKAIRKIFETSDFVTSPKLIEVDKDKGILVFEYIENLQPIWSGLGVYWFEKIGETLGLIHKRLKLPQEYELIRKRDHRRKGIVFIHGDFCNKNRLNLLQMQDL